MDFQQQIVLLDTQCSLIAVVDPGFLPERGFQFQLDKNASSV